MLYEVITLLRPENHRGPGQSDPDPLLPQQGDLLETPLLLGDCDQGEIFGVGGGPSHRDPVDFPLPDLLEIHRITSYNVCYTKLLRFPEGWGFGKPDVAWYNRFV